MFFILSKILHYLLMPLYWVFGLFITSFFAPQKRKKALLISGLLILYLYSTDFLLYPIYRLWEYPPIWYKQISNDYEAAIVLGGMASPGKLPDDRVHFGSTPDRITHAMQLYKLGKVKKIIITGGSGEMMGKKIPEAEYLKQFLIQCEVKEADILYENKSRNTRENALYSLELINKNFDKDSKFILVTSGWHMRRSVACFEKVGMHVLPFSVEPQSYENNFSFNNFIPNPWSPARWYTLMHEVFGYITYKMAGYL